MSKMIKKRFQYSEQSMIDAIHAVKKKDESVSSASRKYNVPRSTLFDKLTQKNPERRTVGPGTILSAEEEQVFATWVESMTKAGFPITKSQLLDSVQNFIVKNKRQTCFTNNRPGRKWYAKFLNRHPNLVIQKSQTLTKSLKAPLSEPEIREWFNKTHTFLKNESLDRVLLDPSRIWDTHELGFYLNPKDDVLVRRGNQIGDDKDCITTLLMGNAKGVLAPPMVTFKYQRLPPALLQSVPENWKVGKSTTGWSTTATFLDYIKTTFHPWLLQNQIELPVVLFMDRNSTNLSPDLTQFCDKNKIHLVALCPSSSPTLQPFDVGLFNHLKTEWKNQTEEYQNQNNGQRVQRENFAPLLNLVLSKIDNTFLTNGFRETGLYPFDPNSIDYQKCLESCNSLEFVAADVQSIEVEPDHIAPEEHFFEDDLFFLRALESHIGDKVDDFLANSGSLKWDGDVKDQSLFELWMKFKIRVEEISL